MSRAAAMLAELDARNAPAPDSDYRAAFSTGARNPLKPGETWRGRLVEWVNSETRAVAESADGRWMTYAELGQARGISKESALKLAIRHKWRKQPDNEGHVRVYVPIAWAGSQDTGVDTRADTRVDMSIVVKPLEAAIMTLREQLTAVRADQERERAAMAEQLTDIREQLTAARADLDRERERSTRAEAETVAEREARKQTDTRADQAEVAAAIAQAEVEQLRQTDEARRASGLLARLRAALHGG
jgi:hypothetical protein